MNHIHESIHSKAINLINEEVGDTLSSILRAKYLGQVERYPARSCREILTVFPNSTSREYWLINSGGTVFQAFCNMELTCGSNNIRGWMRVANLNYSDTTQNCPQGFRTVITPSRYCLRNENNHGCSTAMIITQQVPYTKVCGRAAGVQIGSVDGFLTPNPTASINEVYVEGISLTYGSSRNHIWTFAGAVSEQYTTCPCSLNSVDNAPRFVGEDYFCESGNPEANLSPGVHFPNDLLWDGTMCRSVEVSCCTGGFSPPWFYKNLGGDSQISDIEMRLCINEGRDEDIGLKELELYIQ